MSPGRVRDGPGAILLSEIVGSRGDRGGVEIAEGAVGGLLWVSMLEAEDRFGWMCVVFAVGWQVWVSLLVLGMRFSWSFIAGVVG